MADVGFAEFSPGPIYSLTPKENTLAVLALSDDEDGIFRPSISDQLKVGFFNLDRCTQTETSDIVDLKEMTEVLQELLTEVNFLKSDISFAKKTIEADFEDRLTRKSLELYVRINEKVENLQNMHKEKVENLRRAFRQQLADAISRLAALWDKNLETKMESGNSKSSAEAARLSAKLKEMQATVQRNESIIHMLKMQLAQYQNVPEKREATPPPPPPAVDDAELQDLKRKIAKLESMVDSLDSLNEEKTEEIRKLNGEVNKLQSQAAKDKIYFEEVEHELSQVKTAWDADKKSFTRMLEDQKKQYEKTMEQQIAQVRQECMAQARMEVNKLSGESEAELRRLREEKEAAELSLSKERAKQLAVEPPKVVETDTDRLIANEKLWRSLVDKYKKEKSTD